tara:strand:- start:606 stop:1607 length:1002 start_codon:yes stop_codon:yes gene_type:complete
MKKICIIYTHSKIGDLIWQVPYIESISKYHEEKVNLITRKETYAKNTMEELDYIKNIEYITFRKGISYWVDVVKLVSYFFKNKFTHVYILDKVNKPAIAAKIAGVKNIIGLGIGNQKFWLTNKKYLTKNDFSSLNYSEQSQKFLKLNNIPLINFYPKLDVNLNKKELSQDIIKMNGKLISFGIDSGEYYKMWQEENFIKLAEKLYEQKIIDNIFLICSKENEYMVKKIINNSKKNIFINCSGVGLSNVMAAIKKSLFFVGNASGPLNLSAAMGVTSFGLIANDPISELKYSKIITITPENYQDNIWRRKRERMKDLTVDKVYNFIISYIKNNK